MTTVTVRSPDVGEERRLRLRLYSYNEFEARSACAGGRSVDPGHFLTLKTALLASYLYGEPRPGYDADMEARLYFDPKGPATNSAGPVAHQYTPLSSQLKALCQVLQFYSFEEYTVRWGEAFGTDIQGEAGEYTFERLGLFSFAARKAALRQALRAEELSRAESLEAELLLFEL